MSSFAIPAVYQCPGCEDFFLRMRMATINFFGTRDWSDGAPTAWWAQKPLVRCGTCAALFWLDDIEPLGVLPETPDSIGRFARLFALLRGDSNGYLRAEQKWRDIPSGWKTAQYTEAVVFDDVAHVLNESDGLHREKLLWLRRRTWWSLNDRLPFWARRCAGQSCVSDYGPG